MANYYVGYIHETQLAPTADYKTGTQILLIVPNFTYSTSINTYYANITAASAAHPNEFDNTYTLLVLNDTWEDIARTIGFTNIINIDDYTGNFYIYINTNTYIYINKTRSNVEYYVNGVVYYDSGYLPNASFGYSTGACLMPNSIGQGYSVLMYNMSTTGNQLRFYVGTSGTTGANFWQYASFPPSDPYADGGTSTTGGGEGTFDGTTAAVDFPAATPTAGAGNSGFIKLFNPSAANLAALAAYLWGTFDISSFKSIYNNPIDCIIALLVVPVTPTVGAAGTISLGNIATTVSAPVISDQFVIFDCGSININEYWGAYLDYDPYTKCEIYLPYIGVQDIDINDIQGKTIQLKYYIDVLSGACVAMLKAGDDVLYNWSGQCGAEVPITSTGFGSAFQTALSAGNAIGETIVNAMSGIPQSLSLVASSVFNGARSKVHKSGSIGSMAGHMGIQKPYLIITRPVQSVPENLNEITGYPSNITATLGDLSGYTEIDTIHLAGIPATSEELAEIDELLKGGVFI